MAADFCGQFVQILLAYLIPALDPRGYEASINGGHPKGDNDRTHKPNSRLRMPIEFFVCFEILKAKCAWIVNDSSSRSFAVYLVLGARAAWRV
jgi:hypothetical protein